MSNHPTLEIPTLPTECQEKPTIRWEKWAFYLKTNETLEIRCLVGLSINARDPDRIPANRPIYKEYQQRIKDVCDCYPPMRNRYPQGYQPSYTPTIKDINEVSISWFIEFADHMGWDLPEWFPPHRSEEKNQDELTTKRKNTYLLMIDGLLKHAKIDPQKRGIAPAIKVILEQYGNGIDEKTIRAIIDEIPKALESRQK